MMNDNEIREQISRMIDGTLSKEEQVKLIQVMESDPEVQDLYTEMIQLDCLLRTEVRENQIGTVVKNLDSDSNELRTQLRITRYLLTSAVILCLCLIGYQFFDGKSSEVNAGFTLEGEPVAVISRIQGAKWKKGANDPKLRETVYPGWLELEKGEVTLGMLNGTNLFMKGPARLGLNAHHRATLQKGKIYSSTPEGKSMFTLGLDWATVKSDGSLFEMIEADDESLLRVHQGQVHVQLNEEKKIDHEEKEFLLNENEELHLNHRERQLVKSVFKKSAESSNLEIGHQDSEKTEDLQFSKENLKSFGYQDGQYSLSTHYSIEENGNQLTLEGNVWKALKINAEMTPDTVIEFDFRSDREGQIHGIGFSKTVEYSNGCPVFQIYGYENIDHIRKQFHHYEGTDWQHFRIPVGLFLNGKFQYLLLIADEDVMGTAHSQFKNLRISNGR